MTPRLTNAALEEFVVIGIALHPIPTVTGHEREAVPCSARRTSMRVTRMDEPPESWLSRPGRAPIAGGCPPIHPRNPETCGLEKSLRWVSTNRSPFLWVSINRSHQSLPAAMTPPAARQLFLRLPLLLQRFRAVFCAGICHGYSMLESNLKQRVNIA